MTTPEATEDLRKYLALLRTTSIMDPKIFSIEQSLALERTLGQKKTPCRTLAPIKKRPVKILKREETLETPSGTIVTLKRTVVVPQPLTSSKERILDRCKKMFKKPHK